MTGPGTPDPLALDPERMRRLGYRAVDALVEATTEWSMPPIRRATPAAMRALLHEPAPESPVGAEVALERLLSDVVPNLARLDHPRYMAFIPASGTWPGALGDLVASALSVYGATWLEAAGPTQLELTVSTGSGRGSGMPEGTAGQLIERRLGREPAGARVRPRDAGGPDARRPRRSTCPTRRTRRSPRGRPRARLPGRPGPRAPDRRAPCGCGPESLADAIDADVRPGRMPLASCVTAGTTNAGAVDPLRAARRRSAAERGVWLHVDGAYGGFAALTERGRAALDGIELADSLTLDPHKWLYQPYECGCAARARAGQPLERAFEVVPGLPARRRTAAMREVNFGDRGPPAVAHEPRAEGVAVDPVFGVDAFREAIDRAIDHAEHAAQRMEASDRFELLSPAPLGIVCFRRRFDGVEDEQALGPLNAAIAERLETDGTAFISSTTLRGRYALRLCPMNHATTRADVDAVVDAIEAAPRLPRGRPPDARARPVTAACAGAGCRPRSGATPARCRSRCSPPPSSSGRSTVEALAEARALGRLRALPAGTRVIRQWDVTRDFFVVLEGEVAVARDEVEVDRLRAGGFFGELAALDWGRGYGYARNATVTTTEPTLLLTYPDGALPRR